MDHGYEVRRSRIMKAASESSPRPQPLEALKSAATQPNYADAIKKLFRCDGSQQGHPNTAKIRETVISKRWKF